MDYDSTYETYACLIHQAPKGYRQRRIGIGASSPKPYLDKRHFPMLKTPMLNIDKADPKTASESKDGPSCTPYLSTAVVDALCAVNEGFLVLVLVLPLFSPFLLFLLRPNSGRSR